MPIALRALATAVVAAVVAAAPAQAAFPPPLKGQRFHAQEGYFYGETLAGCSEGDALRAYGTAGPANPYPGHWIDSPTVDFAPPEEGEFTGELEELSGEFVIDSDVGYVTGVRWPVLPQRGGTCGSFGPVRANFRAIIETPSGVFTDGGPATLYPQMVRLMTPPWWDYDATFDSTAATTERVLFGNYAVPRSLTPVAADTKQVSPFPLFLPATVRKVYVWLDGKGAESGSQVLRAVVYRHGTGGAPGTYVTRSFEFTVPAGMEGHWAPFWLAPIPKLDPGVYWIGIQSGGNAGVARFGWRPRPSARRFNGDAFADGAADPFGATSVDEKQLAAFVGGSY